MIDLAALIAPDRTRLDLPAEGKRDALGGLAGLAAGAAGAEAGAILEALLSRERLGTTGLGGGIAVPHCRLPGLERPVGAFARLGRPVEFDALDGEPVDLVFLLVAPEGGGNDHLKALARIARLLRDPGFRAALRAAPTAEAAHALLTGGGDRAGPASAGGGRVEAA